MKSPPSDDALWEYALDALPAGERAGVSDELARSPELRARLGEIHGLLAGMAGERAAPSPRVKEQLMARVSTGPERFAPLLGKLAAFVDLPVDALRPILGMLERRAEWKPSVLPDFMQYDFTPGPRLAGCDVGLVVLPPRFHFPLHTHEGREQVMVLAGRFRVVGKDTPMLPGDVEEMLPGSQHAFNVEGDEECILMATLSGPLKFH